MQIYINRTVPLDDLLTVETLHGYTFTKEQAGHVFDIGCTRGGRDMELSGTCYAYFRRADNTTVHLNTEDVAQIDDMTGHAVVTLHPDCYNVPGRFQLSIYNATESGTVCIYCAVGMVQDAVSGTMLDVSGKSGYDTAVFARNVGNIEGELETVRAENAGIIQALAAANIRALNVPNLLPFQPEGVSVKIPNGTVVVKYAQIPAEDATAAAQPLTFTYEDEAITAGMVLHYVRSPNWSIVTSDMVTAVISAGSATVTIAARSGEHEDSTAIDLCFCVQQTAILPPGEAARYYLSSRPWLNSTTDPQNGGEEIDQISERVVTLTGSDIINDADGKAYDKAVAFTVANAPTSGYNNADVLVFNYGTDGGTHTRENGTSYTYPTSGVLDLVDGETYTLSCFARVTSGTKARLVLAYGHNASGYVSSGYEGNHKYIDIENTTWERVVFSFIFHETATYEAAGANPYTVTVNHKKRVGFGVCRKWDGTVQLAGFRLTHGGLYGDNTVDTLAAEVAELRAQVAELQATVLENA